MKFHMTLDDGLVLKRCGPLHRSGVKLPGTFVIRDVGWMYSHFLGDYKYVPTSIPLRVVLKRIRSVDGRVSTSEPKCSHTSLYEVECDPSVAERVRSFLFQFATGGKVRF